MAIRRTTAHEIFSGVQASAKREMERSSLGLFFSGLSGGLNISFGFMAVVAAQTLAPAPWKNLFATAAYPLGFLLVILPRAQLFTENTLTPIVLALREPSRDTVLGTARIWGVVLLANLLGAFLVSLLLANLQVGTHIDPGAMRDAALRSYAGSWGAHFVRGIFGAWLVALLVWMLHAGASPLGEAILIWLTTAMIYLGGFNHSVAGAVEGLYLANTGVITYVEWALSFQAPITLGNAVGGIVFVALVNWGQAVGAGSDVEVAERQQAVERVHDEVVRDRARVAARDLVAEEGPERVDRKLSSDHEASKDMVKEALRRSHGDPGKDGPGDRG